MFVQRPRTTRRSLTSIYWTHKLQGLVGLRNQPKHVQWPSSLNLHARQHVLVQLTWKYWIKSVRLATCLTLICKSVSGIFPYLWLDQLFFGLQTSVEIMPAILLTRLNLPTDRKAASSCTKHGQESKKAISRYVRLYMI